MLDLSCTIGKVRIDPCIMNGPGEGSASVPELMDLARSKSGAIVTTSMTLNPVLANEKPNYYAFATGSVSSMGFANLGNSEYAKLIPQLKNFQKPIIASVTGSSVDEFVEVARNISKSDPDLIQLDLSHPSVEQQDFLVGYKLDYVEKIIRAVKGIVRQPLGIMIIIWLDPQNVVKLLSEVVRRAGIDFVVVAAPLGTGLVIDVEKERSVLKSAEWGVGRLSGPIIKPIILAEIRLLHQALGGKTPIIAASGINNGVDVFECLLAGAVAAQVNTALLPEGSNGFSRLAGELSQLMGKKNYSAASKIVGTLKS